MKKLQKDYTTPEQSKMLLELGVPKWTANFKHPCIPTSKGDLVLSTDIVVGCQEIFEDEIPLWSTGRLIEILAICNAFGTATIDWVQFCSEQPPLQTIYDELCAGATQALLDFSKLEK